MKNLKPKQSVEEGLSDFFLRHIRTLHHHYPGLKCSRLLDEFKLLLESNTLSFDVLSEQLLQGIPLAYISGQSYFYNQFLKIRPGVLIPRYESEILVEKALEFLKTCSTPIKMIDVGTGPGTLLAAILKEFNPPHLKSWASDLDTLALELARENLQDYEVTFIQADRLQGIDEKFDLIISNPPYIKKNLDRESVHHQVLKYEPELALFLDDLEYDDWFESFFKQVAPRLNAGGLFIMEGHEDHLEGLKTQSSSCDLVDVELLKDLTGRWRFLLARK